MDKDHSGAGIDNNRNIDPDVTSVVSNSHRGIRNSIQSAFAFIIWNKKWHEIVFSEADIANRFGLTEEEKLSIEKDVLAGKPISATPAYVKLFSSILPEWFRQEKKGELVFSLNKPEYEVYEGFIRANYIGAVVVIEKWLSALLGYPVALPTEEEATQRIMQYKHFMGCRNAHSWKLYYRDHGFTWIRGGSDKSDVNPYISCYQSGESSVNHRSNRFSLSLFPSLP